MMGQAQVFEFQALVKRVAGVFRLRTDTEDFRAIASSYFRALSRHDLADLERGADAWIATAEKFPKPFEWARAIPRQTVEIPVMTDAQAREWVRAESLKWEDHPCTCRECHAAGVDWKPLRFVPEFTVDDLDRKVKNPLKDRVVTAGHWAHGEELNGYYRAKGEFYAKCAALGLTQIVKALPVATPRVKGRPTGFTELGR